MNQGRGFSLPYLEDSSGSCGSLPLCLRITPAQCCREATERQQSHAKRFFMQSCCLSFDGPAKSISFQTTGTAFVLLIGRLRASDRQRIHTYPVDMHPLYVAQTAQNLSCAEKVLEILLFSCCLHFFKN